MGLHTESIKDLPSHEYIVIEEIHSRLDKFLIDLKDACSSLHNQLNCGSFPCEKNASCRGLLPSFCYDLIDIVGTHSFKEELIMLNRPNVTEEHVYFRLHWKDHIRMMGELGLLVKECTSLNAQGDTAQAYRLLYQRILVLFEEHNRVFNNPFLQSTIAP